MVFLRSSSLLKASHSYYLDLCPSASALTSRFARSSSAYDRTHRIALTGIRRQRPSTAAVIYRYGLGEARAADTDWIGVWCTAAVKHRGNGIEL